MKRRSIQEARYLEQQINKSNNGSPSLFKGPRYTQGNKIGSKEKIRKNLISQLIESNWDQNLLQDNLRRRRNLSVHNNGGAASEFDSLLTQMQCYNMMRQGCTQQEPLLADQNANKANVKSMISNMLSAQQQNNRSWSNKFKNADKKSQVTSLNYMNRTDFAFQAQQNQRRFGQLLGPSDNQVGKSRKMKKRDTITDKAKSSIAITSYQNRDNIMNFPPKTPKIPNIDMQSLDRSR